MSLIKKVLKHSQHQRQNVSRLAAFNPASTRQQEASTRDDLASKKLECGGMRRVSPCIGLYEQELKRSNALDFGDLLFKTYDLFRTYPEILASYQDRFQFIRWKSIKTPTIFNISGENARREASQFMRRR